MARNAGRRSHVFVGRRHRVRRHRDVRDVFCCCRLAENFISSFRTCYKFNKLFRWNELDEYRDTHPSLYLAEVGLMVVGLKVDAVELTE